MRSSLNKKKSHQQQGCVWESIVYMLSSALNPHPMLPIVGYYRTPLPISALSGPAYRIFVKETGERGEK
jgi:hypothetical protein